MDNNYKEAVKKIETLEGVSYETKLIMENTFSKGYDFGYAQAKREIEANQFKFMKDFLSMQPQAQEMMKNFYQALDSFQLGIKDEDKCNVSDEEANKIFEQQREIYEKEKEEEEKIKSKKQMEINENFNLSSKIPAEIIKEASIFEDYNDKKVKK
jgi:hypothetical protein